MKRDMITIEEIADKLGIGYQAAQRRLKRAEINPDDVIGRTAFYYPSVVEQIWIEGDLELES